MTDDKLLERLAKLQKKADQIRAQMKAQKARAAKAERRNDARRKIILGGALIKSVKDGDTDALMMIERIRRTALKRDRYLFENWTIESGRKPDESNREE